MNPENRLPDRALFVALLSAGLFVTVATFSRVPVSTSQAIVGGVDVTGLQSRRKAISTSVGYFRRALSSPGRLDIRTRRAIDEHFVEAVKFQSQMAALGG